MNKELVNLRNAMKRIKPAFTKQKFPQKKRLKEKWRKPRGSDSKIKVCKKGYPRKVKVGFRGPKEARNLSREGFRVILVKNEKDLQNVNKAEDVICISKVGLKKKIEIVKLAIQRDLTIINVKDASKLIEESEKAFKEKKEVKLKKKEEKEKKVSEKDKEKKKGIEAKIEETKDIQAEKEEKEKEEKDKKEKDKLLTKREI